VSAHGRIRARVAADDTLRMGVVSMSHGWGALPHIESYEQHGSSTNDLVPTGEFVEPINAMPWYSAVPVDVEPVDCNNPEGISA
jgi:hypothetical protein